MGSNLLKKKSLGGRGVCVDHPGEFNLPGRVLVLPKKGSQTLSDKGHSTWQASKQAGTVQPGIWLDSGLTVWVSFPSHRCQDCLRPLSRKPQIPQTIGDQGPASELLHSYQPVPVAKGFATHVFRYFIGVSHRSAATPPGKCG